MAAVLRVPEIVAHRGASWDAPENTLPAVEVALAQQADAIEIDVRVSRDGRVVVIHDSTTGRTAGSPRPVRDQLLQELRELDAGSWKSPQFAGTRIPTLEELLHQIPQGKRVLIELKCGPEVIPDLRRTILESDPRGERTVLIAFSLPLLRQIRPLLPRVAAYWVWDIRKVAPSDWPVVATRLRRLCRRADLQGLNLSACSLLDSDFVNTMAGDKLHLGCWTVDDAEVGRRMAAAGVPLLTTNRPGWMRTMLETATSGSGLPQ